MDQLQMQLKCNKGTNREKRENTCDLLFNLYLYHVEMLWSISICT